MALAYTIGMLWPRLLPSLRQLSRGAAAVAMVSGMTLLASCDRGPVPLGGSRIGPLGGALGIDEQLPISGLSAGVDAVRDHNGRTHIYARTLDDAMRAQGYLVGRDRHVQIEVLRRLGSGQIAEVFGELGPGQLESDIAFRQVGLRRVAEKQYALVSGETKALLDAYADGVAQAFAEIREGRRPLATGVVFLEPQHFGAFTAVDALTIGRLQTWLLSYSGDLEIAAQRLLDDLRDTFSPDAEDPLLAKRHGMERDFIRFAPPSHATTIDSLDDVGTKTTSLESNKTTTGHKAATPDAAATTGSADDGQRPSAQVPGPQRATLKRATGFMAALARGRALLAPNGDFGSNGWVVAPVRSQSGHAMLASDPHLALSSPAVFWPVSIHVVPSEGASEQPLNVGGIAFPGVPGIILGHNEHVAWGATVAGYDVTDVYSESLSEDGKSVMHKGQAVPLQTIEETIKLPNGKSVSYTVQIVPHHGPIIPTIEDGQVVAPDPDSEVLSVRWTGHDPSDEISVVFKLLRAKNVMEARAAFADYGSGAQNWMLADSEGHIGWTSQARVPLRAAGALNWDAKSYSGKLPCLVLPGDGSADWTGFWEGERVPWAENPLKGYLATANQDPVGLTLDNDPSNDTQADGASAYLACSFAVGFRQARIQQRIEEVGTGITLDDMSIMQGDVRSPLGAAMVPSLLLAMDNAIAEFEGTANHPDLEPIVAEATYDQNRVIALAQLLRDWRDGYGYFAASGMDPDTNGVTTLEHPEVIPAQATLLFNAWMVRFLRRTFGDELTRVGRPSGDGNEIRAMLHLLSNDPPNLATYDPATGDSALWDDLDTPEVESRQERMMRALLDALSWLDSNVEQGIDWWRWGQHHTVRFAPLVPQWEPLNIPALDDPIFANGFPRPGDLFAVDSANFDYTRAIADDLSFAYRSGATQRFVIDMVPGQLRVRNALPGGAVSDPGSSHFSDQVEQWRRNAVHDVPFYLPQVIAAAEARAVLY